MTGALTIVSKSAVAEVICSRKPEAVKHATNGLGASRGFGCAQAPTGRFRWPQARAQLGPALHAVARPVEMGARCWAALLADNTPGRKL